jgi:autotransporter-associated beta strand protein
VGFQLGLAEQGYGALRRSVVASMLCAAAIAGLFSSSPARAQSFTWGGGTTVTADYGAATNWSNPASAPPIVPSQSAIFGSTGSSSVVVGGPIGPASWTFNADAQAYSISGANVLFGLAGASSGIFNNANSGQTISISNNIIEVVAGAAQVQQLGNSTLVLSGSNDYSGGTLISAGTVQATNINSVGAGAVTLNGGTFQADGLSNLIINNDFKVNTAGGTVDNHGTELALAGNISNGNGGTGVLQLIDSTNSSGSVVVLSGTNNTYTGGTTW